MTVTLIVLAAIAATIIITLAWRHAVDVRADAAQRQPGETMHAYMVRTLCLDPDEIDTEMPEFRWPQ